MIVPVSITLAGRSIELAFELEEGNVQDAGIMYYLSHGQICEPEVCEVLARALREGDIAVDAGANVGFFTLIMSRLVGDSGRVIAVEPGPNNIQKLHSNILLNECRNVTVIDKPLWCSPVDVPFFLYEDGGSNSLWGNEGDRSNGMMKATTLDVVCDGLSPKLIKMDIEGGEADAVQGAKKLLAGNRPIIVSEVNAAALRRAGSTPFKLRKSLETFGYRPFVLHANGALPTQVPSNSRIEPTRQNSNLMFSTLLDVGKAWPEVSF